MSTRTFKTPRTAVVWKTIIQVPKPLINKGRIRIMETLLMKTGSGWSR